MQHVMLAASAALTDALKDSLSGQPDENIILPATLKTAQTAALVNEIRQWHACHTVAAIAGELGVCDCTSVCALSLQKGLDRTLQHPVA